MDSPWSLQVSSGFLDHMLPTSPRVPDDRGYRSDSRSLSLGDAAARAAVYGQQICRVTAPPSMAAGPAAGRRPGDQRFADLPVMAEWIADAAEPPAVLLAHRINQSGAGGDRALNRGIRIIDDQQHEDRGTT